MADDTPQPLPGLDLVPRLLAYELAKWCEEEENQALIAIMVDSGGVSRIRISDGVSAAHIAFAGALLQSEALKVSMDSLADDPDVEDEEDEDL